MIHRARDLLVRQRTAAVNALRGHLAEFGIVAAKGTAKAHDLMRLAGDDERLPPMAREALGYIVAQIHDIEAKLRAFEQRIVELAKGRRGVQTSDDGAIDWSLYRHCARRDRRRSSQLRVRSSFRGLVGTDPVTAFHGRQRETRPNKQAGRQLRSPAAHSRRQSDRGSRARRSGPKCLDLQPLGSTTFQRRHCSIGKQDCSYRMGGHVDAARVSSSCLIAWHPKFRLCEGNRSDDGNPVGPELAKPAGSIGPKMPANVIGRQFAYLIKVSNDVAPKTE